jgi:hypothetical protein
MAAITTGAHPKELWPGVKNWFGQVYDELPREYTEIYDEETSDKAYEEDVESYSFSLAVEKEQGKGFTYDEHTQGYTARYTHSVWGLGYIVTMEELEDNQYKDKAFKRAKMLAQSLNQTKEVNGAVPFNFAFDATNAPIGDGVAMCSALHPTMAGNQSNVAATPADFSEAALEDGLIAVSLTRNNRGHITNTKGVTLIVHPNDQFNAIRVLGSPLTTTDAGNAINAVRQSGAIAKHVTYHFLTNTVNWFIKTDYPEGLKLYQRSPYRFAQDNDGDTLNAKAKAWERYKFGITDWRGIWGNQGV